MIDLHREPDGVAQAVEDALKAAISTAATLGRQLAQRRAQAAHDATAKSREEQTEYRARFEIERAAMHAKLAPASLAAWWQKAEPEEILDAWATSMEWQGLDAQAAQASTRIRSEFEVRYNIDLKDLDDPVFSPSELKAEIPSDVAGALRDYRESRYLVAAAGQSALREMVAALGPRVSYRPRRNRGSRRSPHQAERQR